MSPEVIDDYLETGEYESKAGAYAIQGLAGALLISRVEGCYYNVVGLPLRRTCDVLTDLARGMLPSVPYCSLNRV